MTDTKTSTDRELWREREGDYYADSIHVTKSGGIGINCGGTVHVRTLREWHSLANPAPASPRPPDGTNGLWQPISTWDKKGRIRILGAIHDFVIGDIFYGDASLLVSRCGDPDYVRERGVKAWRYTEGERQLPDHHHPTYWMPLPASPRLQEPAVPTDGRPTLPEELVQLCEKWEAEERRCQEIIANPASGWSQMIEQERARTLRECIDATRRLPAPPVPAASVTPAVEREAMELVKRMANRRAVSADGTPSLDDATKDYIEARRLVAAARGAGGKGEGQ